MALRRIIPPYAPPAHQLATIAGHRLSLHPLPGLAALRWLGTRLWSALPLPAPGLRPVLGLPFLEW